MGQATSINRYNSATHCQIVLKIGTLMQYGFSEKATSQNRKRK